MKFFRTLILLVSVSAVIAGSYFFVSRLLDEEMRVVIRERIQSLDANYDTGFAASIQWPSSHNTQYNLSTYGDDLPTVLVNTPRAHRILDEFVESSDPVERVWAALIAADNYMPTKCVNTLWILIEKAESPRASAIAYHYLREFAGITTPRAVANADKLTPPTAEEIGELEKHFPKK